MSGTHAHSVAYVRDTMVDEQTPPVTSFGIIGWLRENLFAGWLNSILTFLALAFIYMVLSAILPWLFQSSWTAQSLDECRQQIDAAFGASADGACWAVIRERYLQLIFGFYPAELYWRPILAFVVAMVALAPIMFTGFPRKMLWLSAAAPFLVPWLLWGGSVWMPLLVIAGFVLAFAVLRFGTPVIGELGAAPLALLLAALWWLYAVAPINGAIGSMIANIRMPAVAEALSADADRLPGEIAELEARAEALQRELAEADAAKEEKVEAYEAAIEGEADAPEGAAALGAEIDRDIVTMRAARDELAYLRKIIGQKSERLSEARTLLNGIEAMPENRARRQEFGAEVERLSDALPASVSGYDSVQALPGGTPEDDRATLEALLEAETNLRTAENAIALVHQEVGRIGLEPVESRRFGGFMLSITIGLVAITLSLPIGVMLALGRQSGLFIVRTICVGFIEFIRGVPLITLLFVASVLLNYFLPPGTDFDIILRVIIMVTLFASAYMAEVVRGGLAALPTGQYEAADALGLDYWKAQRLIIMPQALKISIPGIVSTFIGVFKDTTLVSIIGLFDPIGLSNAIRADTDWNGIVWELYGFIALMFFIFCFSMSRYSMFLEQKLQTENR